MGEPFDSVPTKVRTPESAESHSGEIESSDKLDQEPTNVIEPAVALDPQAMTDWDEDETTQTHLEGMSLEDCIAEATFFVQQGLFNEAIRTLEQFRLVHGENPQVVKRLKALYRMKRQQEQQPAPPPTPEASQKAATKPAPLGLPPAPLPEQAAPQKPMDRLRKLSGKAKPQPKPKPVAAKPQPKPKPTPKPVAAKPQPKPAPATPPPKPRPVAAEPQPKPKPTPKPVAAKPQPTPQPAAPPPTPQPEPAKPQPKPVAAKPQPTPEPAASPPIPQPEPAATPSDPASAVPTSKVAAELSWTPQSGDVHVPAEATPDSVAIVPQRAKRSRIRFTRRMGITTAVVAIVLGGGIALVQVLMSSSGGSKDEAGKSSDRKSKATQVATAKKSPMPAVMEPAMTTGMQPAVDRNPPSGMADRGSTEPTPSPVSGSEMATTMASEPDRPTPDDPPTPGGKVRLRLTIGPKSATPVVIFRRKAHWGKEFVSPAVNPRTAKELIRIKAKGFWDHEFWVTLDRDQRREISLTGKSRRMRLLKLKQKWGMR